MNRPEDNNNPYADLRRVSDQLAQLLGSPEQQHLEELDRFLSDEDVKRHLDHNPEAGEAKKRIDTERGTERQGMPRPNRHRIGADLMRIADTMNNCASCADTAGGLADTALRLAEAFSPLLFA